MFLSCNVGCRASDFPRDYDGACLQMRMSYSPAAHLFLFLVQWTDCNLAGALGLLRILIYKVKCFYFHGFHSFLVDRSRLWLTLGIPYGLGLCGWHDNHVHS